MKTLIGMVSTSQEMMQLQKRVQTLAARRMARARQSRVDAEAIRLAARLTTGLAVFGGCPRRPLWGGASPKTKSTKTKI